MAGIKKFSSFSIGICMVLFALIPVACVDQDFDQPPATDLDPNLTVTTTIAELKAMHELGQFEQITEDLILSGIVISDDEAGNFFKQLVVADETGGIEIRVDMADLFAVYPVGRKVYIRAKNLWLGDYNGLIQLGIGVDPNTGDDLLRIPEPFVNDFIIPATYGHPVVPKVVTIDQLQLSDVSTLIKIEGVQFTSADAGETYADAALEQSLNRDIEDCSQRTIILRSSGFARFAADLTPEGNGSITAVLGVFGDDFQLTIRDVDDVEMAGARCASNEFTIASLRTLFANGTTTIPGGSIRGIVTSDFSSQSVTGRNLYIQDATGGIVVRFSANHSLNLGDEAVINVSGGTLSEFSGLLQIDGLSPDDATFEGHPGDVTPRVATIQEILNNAQAWESTLVRINDVTLTGAPSFAGEVTVTDATGSMILFTRNQSTFAGNALPTGNVTLTALLSEFDFPQLIMRNANDVNGGGTGTTDINESFTSIDDNDDIVLPGWANIAVKGTRLWRAKIFEGNHYAQATAFGDTGAEMESWLITPPISLEEAKKISFETAKAFHVHDGLSVWISSNFNGSDVTGATWTPLGGTIANASDADHTFIPSGDVNLSGFTGPVRVGFKYVGSGPGGQTTTYRVDNVKVEKL